jgi:hypothetical protein
LQLSGERVVLTDFKSPDRRLGLARIHRRGFVEDLSGAAGLVEDVVHVDVAGRAG